MLCSVIKNNFPSFLYHSHYQQRPKHRQFSTLPHVVLFHLLRLRSPNPLSVASVTLSKLDWRTSPGVHSGQIFHSPFFFFSSNQHFQQQSLPTNLNWRLFCVSLAHPQPDVTRFHECPRYGNWTSLQGPVGCCRQTLFFSYQGVNQWELHREKASESSTYH